LASRAFDAVQKYHFGERGKPRFKGRHQLDSVEGKTNRSGIRWTYNGTGRGHVEWRRGKVDGSGDLTLPAVIDPDDKVSQHGWGGRVKYVRLVRRKLNGRNRYYVQLVCEGLPYHKAKHALGNGVVGLDIGPSTIAIVSELMALLLVFCAQLVRRDGEIR